MNRRCLSIVQEALAFVKKNLPSRCAKLHVSMPETSLVYQIKLWLLDVEPMIWRRLEVPAKITLPGLHQAIQVAMGWEDCHLHQFQVGDRQYEIPDPDSREGSGKSLDERRVRLDSIVSKVGTEIRYLYDFGDGWEHLLRLEATLPASPGARYPRCLAGARSGPPEDVGGPFGYEEYLQALADPDHEQHQELLEWRGPFSPEVFDLEEINLELAEKFPLLN
jgi:hypothetical protein